MEGGDRVGAVVAEHGLHALAAQHDAQHLRQIHVVVDDQHARLHTAHGGTCGHRLANGCPHGTIRTCRHRPHHLVRLTPAAGRRRRAGPPSSPPPGPRRRGRRAAPRGSRPLRGRRHPPGTGRSRRPGTGRRHLRGTGSRGSRPTGSTGSRHRRGTGPRRATGRRRVSGAARLGPAGPVGPATAGTEARHRPAAPPGRRRAARRRAEPDPEQPAHGPGPGRHHLGRVGPAADGRAVVLPAVPRSGGAGRRVHRGRRRRRADRPRQRGCRAARPGDGRRVPPGAGQRPVHRPGRRGRPGPAARRQPDLGQPASPDARAGGRDPADRDRGPAGRGGDGRGDRRPGLRDRPVGGPARARWSASAARSRSSTPT